MDGTRSAKILLAAAVGASLAIGIAASAARSASQPPTDRENIQGRQDIISLPKPLKERLVTMAKRPHTYPAMRVFAEADKPSQLFEYYLLDTLAVAPNVFTAIIPGINDHAIPTAANAANRQLPTVGAVRVVLEPKPGLPTDPTDAGAFID